MTFTTNYTAAQAASAVEAIEDHAVTHIPGPYGGTYHVVSSDGTQTYEVAADYDFCTCPAGERGRVCYHPLAAWLLVEGLDALSKIEVAA